MSRDCIKAGVFAYELIKYVSEILLKYRLDANFLNLGVTTDTGLVGLALSYIIHSDYAGGYFRPIGDCFDDMDGYVESFKFPRMALNAVPFYFPEGYTPKDFLAFSAMVIGVGVFYLQKYKCESYLKAAANAIHHVLTYFMLISEFDLVKDLPELVQVSEHCCRILGNPRRQAQMRQKHNMRSFERTTRAKNHTHK